MYPEVVYEGNFERRVGRDFHKSSIFGETK